MGVGETVKDQLSWFEIRNHENHPDIGRSCARGRSAHTSSDVDS